MMRPTPRSEEITSVSPEKSELHDVLSAGRTLLDFFDSFAQRPEEFIIYDDGYRRWSYTYRQVGAAARTFAAGLRAKPIAKGEKVLIWSENRPEWLAAFWGCLLEGVVAVPIDCRASAGAVLNIQRVVHACAILVGGEVNASALEGSIPIWRLQDIELAGEERRRDSVREIVPDDVAEIVFTSGSTATPKGVLITHRNIVADLLPVAREVERYRRYARALAPVRFLNLLPLSHMFGQALATFFPPMLPGVVIFMPSYAPHEVIRQIHGRRVSFLVAVPKMLAVLRQYVVSRFPELARIKADDSPWFIRRLRYRKVHGLFGLKFFGFVIGGAPLELGLEEFWRQLGFMVVQGYGLTETAPIVSFNHPFHLKPGTVGKPLPGVDVSIASDGEILVRGEIVTPGYFSAPVEASKAFENGWFHTGDIGVIDQNGYLVVRGRKKEMIVTPEGLKVFPEDVELVLNRVSGVRDSAVVGRERVHAVVVLEPGADKDEIVRRANAALEDHQKIRTVSVWTAGDLPRTEGTGKLKRPAIERWVDAGSLPVAAPPHNELAELLGRYAPGRTITAETTLGEIGLSSLEQVELMVELEERFNTTIDEAAFRNARKLADLAEQISRPAPAREALEFIEWNRGSVAQLIRRVSQVGLVLPVTRLCAHIKVSGLDVLRNISGPVIFAANHQSFLDVPVILSVLPARWRYSVAPAMWKEFFDAHFHPERYSFGHVLTNSLNFFFATLIFNGFPLPQQEVGVRETVRHIGDLVSDGWSILIFPEGERTITGEIKAFAPGVGMVGSRLRVPVVPIRLRGVHRVWPRYSRVIHPGPVEVAFGPPLKLEGDDYVGLAREVESAVRAL